MGDGIQRCQRILPVQGDQGIVYIRQKHQGAIGVRDRRYLDGAEGFIDRIRCAGHRLVLDIPPLVLVRVLAEFRFILPSVLIIEIPAVGPGLSHRVVVEYHDI